MCRALPLAVSALHGLLSLSYRKAHEQSPPFAAVLSLTSLSLFFCFPLQILQDTCCRHISSLEAYSWVVSALMIQTSGLHNLLAVLVILLGMSLCGSADMVRLMSSEGGD